MTSVWDVFNCFIDQSYLVVIQCDVNCNEIAASLCNRQVCVVNKIKIVVDSEHFHGKWDNLNDFYSHMWVPKGDKNA